MAFAPELSGPRISLKALAREHADDLQRHISSDICRYLLNWQAHEDADVFRKLTETISATEGLRTYAVVLNSSNEAIGSTAYMDFRETHRGVEIGATWISAEYQGTFVNPEMKMLMLDHAFSDIGCLRVQLKCDARNAHSRRAMLKLGCQFEGILRSHMVLRDGTVRDTAMFSIVSEDWPEVRSRLVHRLTYMPASSS